MTVNFNSVESPVTLKVLPSPKDALNVQFLAIRFILTEKFYPDSKSHIV